jgi:hypothetical protein
MMYASSLIPGMPLGRVAVGLLLVLGISASLALKAAAPVPEDGKALLVGAESAKVRVLFRTLDDGPVLWTSPTSLGTKLSVAPGPHKVNVMCEFKGNGFTQMVPGNVSIDAAAGHIYDVSGALDAGARACNVKASRLTDARSP